MTEPIRRTSPLADWSSRFSAASATPSDFSIRAVSFASQVNVRGDSADAAFCGKLHAMLGCEFPTAPNTWNSGNDCSAIWLGPDEWLVVAPDGRSEQLCSALRSALGGLHHSVTDVSANRTLIEISGEDARLVLAKGCPLDLHGSAFGPPQAAQTLLAKAQMVLQCVDARPTFRVFVRNSFAPHVAEWLLDAAAELGASRGIDTRRIASRLA